jgi:glycosyltransferase 2 family protein
VPAEAGTPLPPVRRSRRRPVLLALAAIALILIILAYRTRGAFFRWDLLWNTLDGVDWSWLGVSISLILLSNVARALRWQVMLRPFGRTLGVAKLTSDTAIGLTAVILLGRVGEVVRPYVIAIQMGLPLSSQAAAWLLERTLDLLAVLRFFGYALLRTHSRSFDPDIRTLFTSGGYIFGATGIACLLILFAFRNRGGQARERILSGLTFLPPERYQRVERILDAFSQGVDCTRDPQSLVLLVAYTGLEWAIVVASAGALFRGIPVTRQLGTTDVLVLLGFISLGSVVQVPGLGGGVQIATILALTKIYGVGLEAATGVALLFWVVSTLAILPFGVACAFHEGLNWSKLKLLSTKQILEDPGAEEA